MISNEPVRGSVPPLWFWALPGVERIEAIARGYIPQPPLSRLLGIRPAHVGPGSGSWIMPSSECVGGYDGELEISPLIEAAHLGVATTVLRPGQSVEAVVRSADHFRPVRKQAGNLVAKARVVNASRFFVYTACEIEDSSGRQIAVGHGHAEIRDITPAPPPPPADLTPVEEPEYATPDPFLRSFNLPLPTAAELEQTSRLDILRESVENGYLTPYAHLLDWQMHEIAKGKLTLTATAGEWLCFFSREVSSCMISSLLNGGAWYAMWTHMGVGESIVGLNNMQQFFRGVPADGRVMTIDVEVDVGDNGILTNKGKLFDADGNLTASQFGTGKFVDSAKRRRVRREESKRMLCTLLFTDIVGSTDHAERLGDSRWRALLEDHHRIIRSEIARTDGIEVDTAGDGFFVRFDSPAQALRCARAVVAAVKPLGIEIRAGIHTGECELSGRKLSGMAVHAAARIQALAEPCEILVSNTVKDLAMGSDFNFHGRGQHQLKGVPGAWTLYAAG